MSLKPFPNLGLPAFLKKSYRGRHKPATMIVSLKFLISKRSLSCDFIKTNSCRWLCRACLLSHYFSCLVFLCSFALTQKNQKVKVRKGEPCGTRKGRFRLFFCRSYSTGAARGRNRRSAALSSFAVIPGLTRNLYVTTRPSLLTENPFTS